MRERPILFQGAMVRALLAGTKTQTRRAMRVQPSDETTVHVEHFNQTVVDRYGDEQPGPEVFGAWWHDGEDGLRCPYGAPGDRLWVREAHWWFKDEHDPVTGYSPPKLTGDDVQYRADGDDGRKVWRPSIHMPRWACRLVLEVTAVRVERLQDISEEDAIAEGGERLEQFPHAPWWHGRSGPVGPCLYTTARDSYRYLWDAINGADSWDANPWVWVIEFKRMEPK